MKSIPIRSFKKYVFYSFLICIAAFLIGKNWHYKELRTYRHYDFWEYQNHAERRLNQNKINPGKWEPGIILWDVDNAIRLYPYADGTDPLVLTELEHWRDSLRNEDYFYKKKIISGNE